MDTQPLNEERWRITVALMATAFVLGAVVEVRAAWLLATLGRPDARDRITQAAGLFGVRWKVGRGRYVPAAPRRG